MNDFKKYDYEEAEYLDSKKVRFPLFTMAAVALILAFCVAFL